VLLSIGLRRDSISFGAMVSCAAWPAALQGLQGMQQVPGVPWSTLGHPAMGYGSFLKRGYPNSWMVNGTSY